MTTLRSIGVISIGEMGLGIAQLLVAYGYRVVSFAADRSTTTQQRATSAGVDLRPTLEDAVCESDCLLSIVPPKNAVETAQRVAGALSSRATRRQTPLYFLELNAVSPGRAREIQEVFTGHSSTLVFIDGGIVGGPPRQLPGSESGWKCPALVTSGPVKLPDAQLAQVLHIRHVSDEIGAASGLKMCFATLTKGLTALAIQSFTTAHGLGTLPELRKLLQEYSPTTLSLAERGLVSMPPKAYRWVYEMQEIGETMQEAGFGRELLSSVAEVYRTVAEDSILGQEHTANRSRGQTVEDVADVMHQAVSRKQKTD